MRHRSLRPLALLCAFAATLAARQDAEAQSGGVTLSGRVLDGASGAPLPYLTVQLRRQKDTSFVAGRLTDTAGAFVFTSLAKGEYRLDVRRIGYAPLSRAVFVGELSRFLDLGVLRLEPAASTVDQVTVTASRDEVASAMDRKSYTLADNIAQSGSSVLQAMAALPGVTITQDGKLQLRGSDKVAVLIDGKQSALTGVASQAGLENLPASAIDRIEIITNPGAKFDANASAGIINLVLKQETQDGFNGTVGFTGGAGALWSRRDNLPDIRAQRLRTPKLNPSLALNYRNGRTNSFLRADWLYAPTLNKNEFATRSYTNGTVITQQILRNRRTDYATLNAGVDHAFDARNTLTVSGLFNREKILDDGDNPYFEGSLRNRYRLWQFLEDEVKYTAFGSTVFTHRFAQPGHTLAITGTYSFHREDEQYFFTNTRPTFIGKDAFKLLSDEHIGDLNVDYVRPLPQGRVELGFKGRYRSIPVDMQFFPGVQSPIDSGAGGWATYRETIPAAYASYVYEGPAVEMEGGLRVEQVLLDYDVNPTHNTYRSDGYRYFQPFPTVRIGWKPADQHKLSLFFNRRVDRPNEVDIRIFPKYDEPELIKVGNPGLRPQFTTSVDLGYRTTWARGSLYAAGYRRIVDATITRIATQAPGSPILYSVFQNAGRSWITGSELVWQQTLSRGVTLSTNATVYRTTIGAFAVVNRYPVPITYSAAKTSLISGNFKVNANVMLPGRTELRVSSIYLAPDLFLQGRIGARYALDVGVRKSVQQGRGEVVLNATDLLNTNQVRRTLSGTDFRYVSTDYLETQVVRVGYSRKF
jgi:outer membrane receptor protein involved in Fe transport